MLPLLHSRHDVVGLTSWSLDPAVVLGLLVAGFLYARLIGVWRPRFAGSAPVERARVWSFYGGLVAVSVALLSPLEPLADDHLLSAHMIQHLLLTMVVPVLLIYGLPRWFYAAARDWRGGTPWSVWRHLTRPLSAFVLFHLPFTVAHVPVIYDLTLTNQPVHIAVHNIFIGTALLVWWPVLAPGREFGQLPPALGILFLFAQTIPGQIVGAMIAFADAPLYAPYAESARVWGISVLADQQIGGLIMWVGTGTAYLGALSIMFFRWANREGADERRRWAVSGTDR